MACWWWWGWWQLEWSTPCLLVLRFNSSLLPSLYFCQSALLTILSISIYVYASAGANEQNTFLFLKGLSFVCYKGMVCLCCVVWCVFSIVMCRVLIANGFNSPFIFISSFLNLSTLNHISSAVAWNVFALFSDCFLSFISLSFFSLSLSHAHTLYF